MRLTDAPEHTLSTRPDAASNQWGLIRRRDTGALEYSDGLVWREIGTSPAVMTEEVARRAAELVLERLPKPPAVDVEKLATRAAGIAQNFKAAPPPDLGKLAREAAKLAPPLIDTDAIARAAAALVAVPAIDERAIARRAAALIPPAVDAETVAHRAADILRDEILSIEDEPPTASMVGFADTQPSPAEVVDAFGQPEAPPLTWWQRLKARIGF